jgi:hypothetical protein
VIFRYIANAVWTTREAKQAMEGPSSGLPTNQIADALIGDQSSHLMNSGFDDCLVRWR